MADQKKPFEYDNEAFRKAAKAVYENGGFNSSQLEEPGAREAIAETMRILETAIDGGLPHEVPQEIRYALENNAFVFSGFKTYHALKEVGLSLTNRKGEIKPFGEFMQEVRKIDNRYNQNYLYAEYNHAVGASLMAARWNDFREDGDRYDLQYRTAADDKVRADHRPLHNITLPIDDPFWDSYLPPNSWNCRCTTVQVRKGKYPASDPEQARKLGDKCTEGKKLGIFRFNPGKQLKIFPDKHPYYKAPNEAKQTIENVVRYEHHKMLYNRLKQDGNYTDVAFDKATGGVKAIHKGHNLDKIGGKYEQDAQNAGVKSGNVVILENEKFGNVGQRFTEGLWNNMLFEVAGCESGTVNNIIRGLKHCASKRKTEIAVIVLPKTDFNKDAFETALRRYKGLQKLGDGQYLKFKKIICVHNQEIAYTTEDT